MYKIKKYTTIPACSLLCLTMLNGCTSSTWGVDNQPAQTVPQVSPTLKKETYHGLKRIVAISRFTDETKRGRGLFFSKTR